MPYEPPKYFYYRLVLEINCLEKLEFNNSHKFEYAGSGYNTLLCLSLLHRLALVNKWNQAANGRYQYWIET